MVDLGKGYGKRANRAKAGQTTARHRTRFVSAADQSASALHEQSAARGVGRAAAASALQAQSASPRGTNFDSFVSALPLHSQSSALGAKPPFNTPHAIPAAAASFNNMIIIMISHPHSAATPTPDEAPKH
jgi:hypothetical protein